VTAPGHAGTAPDPALARAWALLDAGRPEQALDQLARVPAALVEDPGVVIARAEALVRLERWKEAARAARQGLVAAGPDPNLLGLLGLALGAMGDYPAAERAYLDGLREAPHHVYLLCRYALLCLVANQVEKATELTDLAAAIDPHHPMVYVARIETAFVRGGDRAAERASREFLALYPDSATALAMHGATAARRGRTTTAFASMRQAVAAEPTDPHYAEAAREARVNAHPLLVPLRPMYRLGVLPTWAAAAGVIVGSRLLAFETVAGTATVLWLLYVTYSWVAPPLVQRIVPGTEPGARPGYTLLQWILGVVVLAIAAGALATSAPDLDPQLRASRGDGIQGNLVLRHWNCNSGDCTWYGDFYGDDGSHVRRYIAIHEGVPAGAKVLDQLRAVDVGASDRVFPATGSTQWRSTGAFVLGSALVIVAWIAVFPIMALIRRRS
jgi:tetratricopeptide (TPR) repeat protein